MNKLKTTILSLCLILIGVSVILCANAVDNNNTIVFNETDNTTDSINTTNDGVVVSNATTFKELQRDINKYDNIELAHDITRHGGKTIEIRKTVTIDGKGHTIDGEQGRILNIQSNGDLIIKNIKVTNGCSEDHNNGVIMNHGTLSITNSTFTNNTADYGRGAITNYNTLTITSSTLNNNDRALFNEGGFSAIYDSTIVNNDCMALWNNGGELIIINSVLNNNCWGAIGDDNKGNLIVTNCSFKNNHADDGGAIFSVKGDVLNVTDSEFINNTAVSDGGAIYNEGGTLTIQSSTFKGNKASYANTIYNTNYMNIKFTLINGKLVYYSGKGSL